MRVCICIQDMLLYALNISSFNSPETAWIIQVQPVIIVGLFFRDSPGCIEAEGQKPALDDDAGDQQTDQGILHSTRLLKLGKDGKGQRM